MRCQDILDHFQEVAHWVSWPHSVDRFYHGDPAAEVRGIATMWAATNRALERAAARGLNLVICHEPAFYDKLPRQGETADLIRRKQMLLDQAGLILLRCHDTWDRMPGGIVDAWVEALGFPAEQRRPKSFYNICHVPGLTVAALARHLEARLASFGQGPIPILGDADLPVRRLAVGTGAICRVPEMARLGADALLVADDGILYWSEGIWALDRGLPLLAVNHATAEIPGMQAMARYLAQHFPGVPVEFVPDGFPPGVGGSLPPMKEKH